MKNIKGLVFKYKDIISYAFFGICTTLINWGIYCLGYDICHISNVNATIIAWVVAVVFAFITNKIWVFESRTFDVKTLTHEVWTFAAARVATGILDVVIMYLAVDVFALNAAVWKLIANVIVIILNYLLSKILVFRKDK